VCNAHVGYFFNRTASPEARSSRGGAEGADEDEDAQAQARHHRHGSGDEQHDYDQAEQQPRPHAFHALLRDELVDSGGLRGMLSSLRMDPVL
jgi:hypothetical protein